MQISFFEGSKRFKIDKPIRLIELFAGIGSQAKALKNLGVDFEHYRICEFDEHAVKSYNAVHGTNFKRSDITEITANDLGIVDTDKYCYIMTYSFPCQDLSNAGLGKGMAKGSGTRSGLLWEVERLLDECKELPQVLVMENVPQVIGQNNIQHFAKWIEKLEQLGYKNKWEVLNAKDYGLPQNRERCFMVSVLGDYYYEFPQAVPLEKTVNDFLEKNVTHEYYLTLNQLIYAFDCKRVCDNTKRGDLGDRKVNPQIAKTISCRGAEAQRADITNFVVGDNSKEYTLNEIRNIIINSIKNSHLKAICEKTKFGEKILSIDSYNQVVYEDVCQTIRANFNSNNENWLYDLSGIRKYTPKECWRLMGFEDVDIDKAKAVGIKKAQLYNQAGNSIVVNVLMAIFKQMI